MDRVRFNIQMDKVMMTMIGMVVTECVGNHPDSLSCCFGRDTRTRTQGQKTQGHRTQGGKMTLRQKDFTLKDARENRESSNSGILWKFIDKDRNVKNLLQMALKLCSSVDSRLKFISAHDEENKKQRSSCLRWKQMTRQLTQTRVDRDIEGPTWKRETQNDHKILQQDFWPHFPSKLVKIIFQGGSRVSSPIYGLAGGLSKKELSHNER